MKLLKIIKFGLLGCVLFNLTHCKTTQNSSVKEKTVIEKTKTPIFKKDNFPKDWIGNYKGKLQIYSVDSIAMNLEMKLNIAKKTDSVYNWTITYDFKGKKDIRAYELNIVDTKKGHYIIDEKNTIKIDAFYRNKIFTSFFKVMNSFIVATYTKENDNIVFEIISATGEKTTTTGKSTFEGEEIPEVITYFVNGRQKGVLIKE